MLTKQCVIIMQMSFALILDKHWSLMTHFRSVFPIWCNKEFLSGLIWTFYKILLKQNFVLPKKFPCINNVYLMSFVFFCFFLKKVSRTGICGGLNFVTILFRAKFSFQNTFSATFDSWSKHYRIILGNVLVLRACAVFLQELSVLSYRRVNNLALCKAAPDIRTDIRQHWQVPRWGDNVVDVIVHTIKMRIHSWLIHN